ncbi:MAG TPA: BrnT family toxin [Gammaproteobacteria bacterium]|nr:BrnT family toxin [Gammaproteobacteria bacterium]
MTTWDERKRLRNIELHGLDFVGCEAIWDDFTVTREDVRKRYREQRLVTFGRLHGQIVVLVYTERPRGPRIISLRKADKYEARYYVAEAKGFQVEN